MLHAPSQNYISWHLIQPRQWAHCHNWMASVSTFASHVLSSHNTIMLH